MPENTVMLVPGFLGNTLYVGRAGRVDNPVWLNTVKMAAFGLEALTLPLPDRPGLPSPAGIMVEGGEPLEGPYRAFIDFMQVRDWRVWLFRQDWRQPGEAIADQLAARILAADDDWPIHIVCHSRGGLIVRRMLGQLPDDVRAAAIGRVIGVGVPHDGSINAVATLGDASPFTRALRNGVRLARGFYSFIRSGSAVDDCLRSWPALYELLPDPARSDLSAAGIDAIYDPDSYADGGLAVWPAHLAAGRAQWAGVPNVPRNVQWVDVVGYGTDTLVGLVVPYDLTHRRGYVVEDGDGTVAYGSAIRPDRVRIEVPAMHDGMLRDGRLLPVIYDALVDMPAQDVKIRGTVSR